MEKDDKRKEAVEELREKWLTPGNTVYTLVTHVSRSGMQRVIRVYVIQDNNPLDISYLVAEALEWKLSDKFEGVVVKACGMDMGFHMVYTLSQTVFAGDEETQKSPIFKNRDKGYWLDQRWL